MALPAQGLMQLSERHLSLRLGALASPRSHHAYPSTTMPLGEAACSPCLYRLTGKQRQPPWAPAALRQGYLADLSTLEHETAAAGGRAPRAAMRWAARPQAHAQMAVTRRQRGSAQLPSPPCDPSSTPSNQLSRSPPCQFFRGQHAFLAMLLGVFGVRPERNKRPLMKFRRPRCPSFAKLADRDPGHLGDRFPVAK